MHMTSARISDADKLGWTLAKGYSVKSPEPTAPVYLTKTDNSMHAAGGMISTARDLAQFLNASESGKGRKPTDIARIRCFRVSAKSSVL